MEQLLLHLFGDYVIQSDWMAQKKTSESVPALVHAITYTLPFAILTGSWQALVVICLTHFVIDRWRLARYVCWIKNIPSPKEFRHPWSECVGTGYHKDRPAWLAVWLLIIADNTMHLAINYFALKYLG